MSDVGIDFSGDGMKDLKCDQSSTKAPSADINGVSNISQNQPGAKDVPKGNEITFAG